MRLTLGLIFLALLMGGGTAQARVLDPPCPKPSGGFVVSPLCLRLPTAAGEPASSGADLLGRAGLNVSVQPTTGGLLQVQSGIADSDRTFIALAQDRDIAALELDFARAFDPPPSVYVLREANGFELAMVVLFRLPVGVAQDLARRHGGAFDPATVTVALGWHVVRFERPLTMLRHELTHAMVSQIAGPEADLPAWLQEGLAEMSRRSLGGGDPGADLAVAAALVSNDRVSLADLATTESWLRQSALLGGRSYAVARSAAELLSRDVGRAGMVEMLERSSRGETFAAAYAAVATTTLGSFISQFPASVARAAPRPSIGNGAAARTGGNIAWSLSGFPPGSAAAVTIDGAGYHLGFQVAIGEYGTYEGSFGATAPVGAYTITVTGGPSILSTFFWTGAPARDSHDDRPGRSRDPR